MNINGLTMDITLDDLDEILFRDYDEPVQDEIDEATFEELLGGLDNDR